MGNEIDRIEPGHVLFVQEIYSVAFALREHGYEKICARLSPPTRVNARWCNSFTCISVGSSPTSSRYKMPLPARST
jgi:hypothetical protein